MRGLPGGYRLIAAVIVATFAPLSETRAAEDASRENRNAAAPTFARDILPIFQNHCQHCHRPGQVAPMSLLDYADARPRAKAIREAVSDGSMPPWFADPDVGRFSNDPRLTAEEIRAVRAWVDAGAPEGDPADAPPPLAFPTEWIIGEPDLIVAMPSHANIPAEGEDRFLQIVVDPELTEDRWLSGIEVRPGDPSVVHHVMAYARQPGEENNEWSRVLGQSADLLIEYAAGNPPDRFPEGTGRLLKAGATILMQIHYHPTGTDARDLTSLGFTFADPATVRRRVHSLALSNFDLLIPAGAPAHEHRTDVKFDRPIRLLAFQPHMHFRGSSMRLEAHRPDGTIEALCSVTDYNPYWQITYEFETPPDLPAGTTLHLQAVFDNSAANPFNPDPSVPVRWGALAVDEMSIGWIDFMYTDMEG